MSDKEKPRLGDGIRTGLGVLNAFRDAVQETLQEAVERGDLSPERARQAMQGAAQRLQAAMDDTRERLEFVSRREHEDLRREVEALRARVERLEGGAGGTGAGDETPTIIVTD